METPATFDSGYPAQSTIPKRLPTYLLPLTQAIQYSFIGKSKPATLGMVYLGGRHCPSTLKMRPKCDSCAYLLWETGFNQSDAFKVLGWLQYPTPANPTKIREFLLRLV